MADDKTPLVIPMEQAVRAIPRKEKVTTFLQTKKKRVWAPWNRDHIINCMEQHAEDGVNVPGDIALRNGFGLCFFYRIGFMFVETIPGHCPICEGSGKVRQGRFGIFAETCPACHGAGKIQMVKKSEKGEEGLIDSLELVVVGDE